jgi:uncharacterized protein YoxC
MSLIDILLVILIIAAIGFVIYLFFWLKNIKNFISEMQKDVHEISVRVLPLINELTQVAETANRVTSSAEEKVSRIEIFLNNLSDKFTWLFGKSKSLKSNNPAESLMIQIRALSKGLSSFVKRLHSE